MNKKIVGLLFFITQFIQLVLSDTTTTTERGADYLNGHGKFTSSNLSLWTKDKTSSDVTFESVQEDSKDCLKMTKTKDAPLAFLDHHLTYKFTNNIKPIHLLFEFYSTNVETEDTNLRLLNQSLNKTVVLFRCGNAGFVRVNDNQMIDFYNSTITGKSDANIPTWTRCDIFLDWDSKVVKVYLNQTFKAEVNFYFSDVPDIDSIRVYNLKPNTVGFFKDIQLCATPTCDGFISGRILNPMFISMMIIFILSFIL